MEAKSRPVARGRTAVVATLIVVVALAAIAVASVHVMDFRSPAATSVLDQRTDARRQAASRDSAGVEIVESSAPLWEEGEAWRISDAPIVDISDAGDGSPYEFHRVRDILRLANGRLVVADGGSQQLRVYDEDGSLLRSLGGPGDGPGEFRALGRLVALGDGRVAAVDFDPGARGAVFDTEAGLLETFRLPDGVFPTRHPVATGRGEIWGRAEPPVALSEWPGGLHRPVVHLVRLSEQFARVDTILAAKGDETFVHTWADAIPLLGRRTHFVPARDDQVLVGTADDLEFARVDATTGKTVAIARILGVSLAVSAREADRELEARLGPRPSGVVKEIVGSLPVPERRPAYQSLLIDPESNVWAGEFLGLARRDARQRWYVWDANGTWLGVVETPERFEMLRVGSSEALGVRRDATDVEHPQVLRLVKP